MASASTCQAGALGTIALLEVLVGLEGGKRHHCVQEARVGHLLEVGVAQLALGPKAAGPKCEGVLGLHDSAITMPSLELGNAYPNGS